MKSPNSYEACIDFYNIFLNQNENIVLELFSLYADLLIKWSIKERRYLERNEHESDEDY
jgi:hypothetical protein